MELSHEQREELRREWLRALRSGEYRQVTGALETHAGNCCLGVACRVFDKRFPDVLKIEKDEKEMSDGMTVSTTIFNNEEGVLPPLVRQALGLGDSEGVFYPEDAEVQQTLAELNDNGKSFTAIADVIESRPAGLFVD